MFFSVAEFDAQVIREAFKLKSKRTHEALLKVLYRDLSAALYRPIIKWDGVIRGLGDWAKEG